MKFAIVGAGAIGAIHAQSILDNPSTSLAVVCDVDPDAARRLADPQNAAAVTELDEVFALAPDALIVADGTSCRHQIKDGAGTRALHVAEVLEMTLR